MSEIAVKNKDEAFADKAYRLFLEFYEALTPYRAKIRENEELWRGNHWVNENVPDTEPKPVTPILFSTVENVLADIMESYPEPVVRPEEIGDDEKAQVITDVVKWILEKRGHKKLFRENMRDLLVKGACVTQLFWDNELYNGFGDINITNWDIKNFLWDPKCGNDIQAGRACFKYTWLARQWFEEHYPEKVKDFRATPITKELYNHTYGIFNDKNRDDDICLIEYWYKVWDREAQKYRVHMAKLAGGIVLEKSEDTLPEGIYKNGKYPFIIYSLFPLHETPVGMSIIDVFKPMQKYLNKLDQIILKNALLSGKMRLLVSNSSGVKEEDILDWSKEYIKADLIDDSNGLRWFQPNPLPQYIMAYMNEKIELIKEESGQNQFSRGEGGKGVTAAAAIRLLQQAGSKRSRLIIDDIYDTFVLEVLQIIDLIMQFYTETRIFRIRGNNGQPDRFITFNAKDLLGDRENIEFDIKVSAQTATPYMSTYQNEIALQLRQYGVLNELEMLEMMDFEGKQKVIQMVSQRLQQQQMLQAMAMQQQPMQQEIMQNGLGNVETSGNNNDEINKLQQENEQLKAYISKLEEYLKAVNGQ